MPKYKHKGKLPRKFFPCTIEGRKIETDKTVARLQQPLQVNFKGYKGFIRNKDEKEAQQEEGKTTLGITYYYFVGDNNEGGETSFLTYGKVDDIRPIRIRLKKEMFLNRLGYEEFIIKLNEKGGFSYVDICFESVVDTIAHELAHAIVATFEFKYEGEEGGGHGKLFYDICKEIEVMIRADPKFEEFEK
ncbi:11317_t:CDS:2 [Racocetra fulgida]|uniref:11317_t:CDS:1 n=1 Tax=Racocetra fulgida TaxID=60492 RepID=A0A9N8VEW8_9GLOM|nr:11317_t:CDS:2 [Racocetra fulgida]